VLFDDVTSVRIIQQGIKTCGKMLKRRKAYRIFIGKPLEKRPL
jgi:hypothetical protein